MNTKLNRVDIILLGTFFLVSFILQGYDYYQRDALLREFIIDFPTEIVCTTSIVYLYIFWLIPEAILKKKYISFGVYGVLILVVFAGIDYTIGYWSGKHDWGKFPKGLDFIFKMIDRGTEQSAFPFALLLTKKFYEGKTELLNVEKQQKENELKLLRSQINPHFLFNNLNTLDSLIDSDTDKAKEYINRLSLIYRYLIQTKDSEVMELQKELNLAENYMYLIKTRFGNDYNFTIHNNETIEDKFIPTGSLQTLLENVVKHNKASSGIPVSCTITIKNNQLNVINKKTKHPTNNQSFGTGLTNLKARYRLLSDKDVIIINTDTEFSVSIPIINLEH